MQPLKGLAAAWRLLPSPCDAAASLGAELDLTPRGSARRGGGRGGVGNEASCCRKPKGNADDDAWGTPRPRGFFCARVDVDEAWIRVFLDEAWK